MSIVYAFRDSQKFEVPDHPHFHGDIYSMIEGKARAGASPQGYYVKQDPDWNFVSHFHLEEQFQVFVRGNGVIGKHEIAPLAVHYAKRDTGYGPLVAGPEGMDYLTLRVCHDDGLWPLPDRKDIIRKHVPKGQVTVDKVESLIQNASAGTILEPDGTGLGAWIFRVSAGESIPVVDNTLGGGSFAVVIQGDVVAEGQSLDQHSLIFSHVGEPLPEVRAESEQAVVMVLRFPSTAIQPREYPEERYIRPKAQ